MKDNESVGVKPCPFCGCKVIELTVVEDPERGNPVLKCVMCGAFGPDQARTGEDAATLWNTRNYGVQPAVFKPWDDGNKVMR